MPDGGLSPCVIKVIGVGGGGEFRGYAEGDMLLFMELSMIASSRWSVVIL
jgi:hypothetical protein